MWHGYILMAKTSGLQIAAELVSDNNKLVKPDVSWKINKLIYSNDGSQCIAEITAESEPLVVAFSTMDSYQVLSGDKDSSPIKDSHPAAAYISANAENWTREL